MALNGFNPLSSFTSMLAMFGPLSGRELVSIFVKTDTNKSLRMLALQVLSLLRKPSSVLSGDNTLASCLVFFGNEQNGQGLSLKVTLTAVFMKSLWAVLIWY